MEGELTQRTTAAITRLEPLQQASGVELVLASAASTIRQGPIRGNRQDGVADGALADALEVQADVPAEQAQGVDDAPALEVHDGLGC